MVVGSAQRMVAKQVFLCVDFSKVFFSGFVGWTEREGDGVKRQLGFF